MRGRADRFWGSILPVAVVIVLAWAQRPLWPTSPALAVGNVAFGACFALTAVLLARSRGQRPNAVLVVGATVLVVVEETGRVTSGTLAQAAVAAGPLVPVLVGGVMLRYPQRRFDTASGRFFGVNLGCGVLLGIGLFVVGVPPTGVPMAVEPASPSGILLTVRSLWWAVGAAVFVWLLGRRWRGSGSLERHILRPIVTVAGVGAAIIATTLAHPWVGPGAAYLLLLAHAWVAVAIAAAFLASAVLLRLTQLGAVDVAQDLAPSATVADLERSLGRRLCDPRVRVVVWVPQAQSYVDAGGRPARTAGDGTVTIPVCAGDGSPLACLHVPAATARQDWALTGFLAVSRIALESVRRQAEAQVHRDEVQAARLRLLRVTLEERRRLERDLHDGAQQHLLALGIDFARLQAQAHDEAVAAMWEHAGERVEHALGELRRLAGGLYPATLQALGLDSALRSVAERLDLAVELRVAEDCWPESWPPEICGAAYFTACEAMTNAAKHAGVDRLEVVIGRVEDAVQVVVRDRGCGSIALQDPQSLAGLRERLHALGGGLQVATGPGGTCVTGTIPCG